MRFEQLGIKGCTLYYRRSVTDMPLTSMPENPTAKDIATAQRVRQKIFDNIQKKYLFTMAEYYAPVDKIVERGRLAGLVFSRTEISDGRIRLVENSRIEKRSPLVISAIGSLPEPISGIDMDREVFTVEDQNSGKLAGYENLFALGNAVTGRGNIKESQVHGRQVSQRVMDDFLAWQPENYADLFKNETADTDKKIDAISTHLSSQKLLDASRIDDIYKKVYSLQKKTGYDGDYDRWIQKHLPVRLENMVNNNRQ
jgi:hypothetical protein